MKSVFLNIAGILALFFFVTSGNQAQVLSQVPTGNPGKARLDMTITLQIDHGSGEWIVHRKREYRYNEAGQLIESFIDYYDYEENGWLHSRKHEWSWDENGRLVSCLYYKMHDYLNSMVPYVRDDLVYDEQGRLSQLFWGPPDGTYNGKQDYVYNEDGSLQKILEYYKEESGGWYPDELHEFTLDSLGRFQYTTYSEYGGEVYHTRYAMEYSYAENNDLTDMTFYQALSESFIPVFKFSYSYDEVGFEDLTIPYLYPPEEMFFNHKIVQADSLGWVSATQMYVLESRELFYYSGGPSEVTSLTTDRSMKIYPNPCDDHCFLEFADPVPDPVNVIISDLQGRIVESVSLFPVHNRIEIPVARLDPGIYMIRTTLNGKVGFTKMVKN